MPKLSSNALRVLEARYLLRSPSGNIVETPDQLFQRVAKTIAKAEFAYGGKKSVDLWNGRFYAMMSELAFLPNSPTIMNAGLDRGQLSACFVLPVEDNTESIFNTLKSLALIQKSGGGTGFNFSAIRPERSNVARQGAIAAGPLGFIKIFDATTEQIKQSGRRRGANMAILNVDHPDIVDFVKAKRTEEVLTNFNLSVGVSDQFMEAVMNEANWKLRWGRNTKVIKARHLWNKLIESAWWSGDPGLIFLDTIEQNNPTSQIGKITATNPCGEMPLLDYESCNLGSINLSRMVKHSVEGYEIDWTKIDTTVADAVRFLDDVIDMNHFLLPESKALVLGNRKIGLGVMGWAEMLIKLGIPYASGEGVRLAGKIMHRIKNKGIQASEALVREKGTFPNWEQSIYYAKSRRRNATITSIAPTGSISIIADTSSSIEPIYSLAYSRHVLNGQILNEVDKNFLSYLREHNLEEASFVEEIINKGTVADLPRIPEHTKKIYLTANEISYTYHLAHQEAFQKHTDNAVSKTINLPNQAGPDQVSDIFMQAWKRKLKGITVYRDGCKSTQVLQGHSIDSTLHQVGQNHCRLCDLV